jgi:glycosyltransferase involved in cell wall biosynthesis
MALTSLGMLVFRLRRLVRQANEGEAAVSIEALIESIGISARDLKGYVLAEIDEFLEASDPAAKEEEFGDILFALMSMAWAHSGQHYALDPKAFESKMKERLRRHAGPAKHARRYLDDRIPELEFGVLHLAFGHFGGQWQHFDALKSGTVAEISLLTDAPFHREGNLTNHCILTFGDTDTIQYEIVDSSSSMDGGNTIRCQIPDFMFVRAKQQLAFKRFGEFLTLQVLAAIDGLKFVTGAIAHFHSWESGILMDSDEFRSYMHPFKTLFSPYLTTSRLRPLVENSHHAGWTMTVDELAIASSYERKLSETCMKVVLESARDRDFFSRWIHPDRLDIRSYAEERTACYPTGTGDTKQLKFVSGGRPVREKGFTELCQQMERVRAWAADQKLEISLSILCRERRADKGASYIKEMERIIEELDLQDVVVIEPKVSLDQLRKRIAASSALIVPSLYDPFCLMPTYSVRASRPAFVSCHAGISENIKSRQFIFDPKKDGDLLRAISSWYTEQPRFEYESCFPSYRDLYLAKGSPITWG